jgi:REP element-mobilizing transposase RayT
MDQNNYQSLSHSKWDCKYHVVFVPKYRRKALYGEIRRQLGPILHELAKQKECQIIEGHLMPDHVHMCILIPPKRSLKKSGRSIDAQVRPEPHRARHLISARSVCN